MNFGEIADLFDGVGAKILRSVEVDRLRSNQHEFQGVKSLRAVLGETSEPLRFSAEFVWVDDDDRVERISSFCTWSNVRRRNPSRAAEYHLYYGADAADIVFKANAGDLLLIAKTAEQSLLVVICPGHSTISNQLLWVFGLSELLETDCASLFTRGDSHELSLAAASVLEKIGVEVAAEEPTGLEQLIDTFGMKFPATLDFSLYARVHCRPVDPLEDPDSALLEWMEYEELLFRALERAIVSRRLEDGFLTAEGDADVDSFISYSLSVQNRRKSRAGLAFGNHIEAVLDAHGVSHTREARTEGKKRPDFLFPSQCLYHNPNFDSGHLTMLGAKTSCKDRWRQVLTEAARIKRKHLITIQPSISVDQTQEMEVENLQLVVPTALQRSYQVSQQSWLYSFRDFIEHVKDLNR